MVCEVRHRRLRCLRPLEPPPPPGLLALGSLSPPPGGLECASVKVQARRRLCRNREMVRGLAEPGLEVRTADGLTEGRAGRGEGVGGGKTGFAWGL